MTRKENQLHSRNTFAVVWDPERGLEAYSGRELPPTSDQGDTFPASVSSGTQAEDGSLAFYDTDERLTFGLDNTDTSSLYSSSKSSYTTAPSITTSQTEKVPRSPNMPSASASPSSKLTFAALWDPGIGLMAFSQGKLAKVVPSTVRWPSTSTRGPTPNTRHHSYEYIDNIRSGFYLRVSPELSCGTASSSPDLEGRHHQPRFSCFDPLNELHFEPHLHPFLQSDRDPPAAGMARQDNHLLDVAPMDDGMQGHDFGHTDDPYLASRFSISTTSTSAYVPINPTSVHDKPPITFLGSRPPRKRGRLMRPRSAGLRHETEVCTTIPRLFRNAPWSKSPEDDKWVLVEVQSVVTDRVLDKV